MERKVEWTVGKNDWAVVAAALDMASRVGILSSCTCRSSWVHWSMGKCGHCQLVEAEEALTRLVAHSALRDLVGAEEAEEPWAAVDADLGESG